MSNTGATGAGVGGAGVPAGAFGAAVPGVRNAKQRWSAVQVPVQERESALPEAVAVEKWQRIYALFGAGGTSEAQQDAMYLAVLVYFVKNGCSPSGDYKRPIRTSDGREAMSGDVVRVTGKLEGEIRQFLRAHEKKSVEALKYSASPAQDPYLAALAEKYGITEGRVYLLADWLKDSPYLMGDEVRVYEDARRARIRDAQVRRMGQPSDSIAVGLEAASVPQTGAVVPEVGVRSSLF